MKNAFVCIVLTCGAVALGELQKRPVATPNDPGGGDCPPCAQWCPPCGACDSCCGVCDPCDSCCEPCQFPPTQCDPGPGNEIHLCNLGPESFEPGFVNLIFSWDVSNAFLVIQPRSPGGQVMLEVSEQAMLELSGQTLNGASALLTGPYPHSDFHDLLSFDPSISCAGEYQPIYQTESGIWTTGWVDAIWGGYGFIPAKKRWTARGRDASGALETPVVQSIADVVYDWE